MQLSPTTETYYSIKLFNSNILISNHNVYIEIYNIKKYEK